ncbi:hypothetical protein N7532_000543 [Penicillium argentinense]|uniref:RING-type domain-containing protein n=1 Tax=Penicillium argentinense TaxID=1131581 RepID=A0A9W9KNZ4_9EURO|nr:uncharacterized protein N7532_000543 [Penicillium argentinense]KAJ5112498.1 hypothetical protein N7532_000543 [Penicillium argentinense]
MGQSSSTARPHPETGNPDYLTSSPTERDIDARNEDMNNQQTAEQNGATGPSFGAEFFPSDEEGIAPSSELNEAAEAWQQPTRLSGGFGHEMRSIEEESTAELDPQEPEYRRAETFTQMAARRQSTMSRLGSRFLPNSVIRGLLNSQEETPAEGLAHRHGLVSRTPPRSETTSGHSSSRFSPFSALGSRGVTRRRSVRSPYYIPSRVDPSDISEPASNSSFERRLPEPSRVPWRRSARLSRVRHSLSTPISHMFGQPSSEMSSPHENPRHVPIPHFLDEPLPRDMDTRLDWRDPVDEPSPELGSMEPPIRNGGPPASIQPSPGLMRMNRLPGLLRARSARDLRQQDPTPLSRVLQLAAAAIAAQLSGTTGPVLPNIQALGNDGLDGSLENFIQSLQHATSAQSQPSVSGEGPSNTGNEAPTPPVNFLRVFRFANSETSGGSNSPSRNTNGTQNTENPSTQPDGMSIDEPAGGTEGRTVTLVVVGVRSVPAGGGSGGEQGPPAPGGAGLDALLGLPFLPNIPRPSDRLGDLGQRADGLPQVQPPRPGAPTPIPSLGASDFPRRPGFTSSRWRSPDAGSRPPYPPYQPSALSESPPGPHPPPSTPAEPGLSAVSSGTSTPSRRPSSASAISPTLLPHLHEGQPMSPDLGPTETAAPPNATRERRRSDSEFARHRAIGHHRAFGSGSVRRNGVVESDQPAPSATGRSWLIYVVGTNLSENHPALTTPSLFTDNPTYEDMILLSSLLGPAKPPVATQDDVDSAGGLFRLVEYCGTLVAEPLEGVGAIQLQDGERCLICLSDYEVAEEVRRLAKCQHVFHKGCIDQWLTTGRNSCPLCRGQGVHESSDNGDVPASSEPDPHAPGPTL